MSLVDALGGMKDVPQWFVWRLVWDGVEGKYQKTPCAHDGSVYRIDASMPSEWSAFANVNAVVARLNAGGDPLLRFALGFWMTADCGYWFLDIDKCAVDGVLGAHAAGMLAAFPGSMQEWSSSKRGVHAFGRIAGGAEMPPHRSRDIHKLNMEFYHQGRGVAFGLDGIAQGSADTEFPLSLIEKLIVEYFPARSPNEGGAVRADWRGPSDDDELIRRALNAKQSAAATFGGKPGFGQLWRGECEHDSSADMALASHLAFWTGCDEERMERLMRASGLMREKWNTHRTYLRELTIGNACAGCSAVYQEPIRSIAVQTEMYGAPAALDQVQTDNAVVTLVKGQVISDEMYQLVETLLDMVTSCGNVKEMHNTVIPAIRDSQVPAALAERLVKTVNKQLDYWDAKLPVGKLRALICPAAVMGTRDGEVPLWAQRHCYVKEGDVFFDTESGLTLTYAGFTAEFARNMPMKDNGSRENPVEWALNRWGMRTVHRLGYRPDKGPFYVWDGVEYANKYNETSVPATATEYTAAGIAGITAFQTHLFDMCGRRPEVFNQMLWWLAHNVQKPGVKIRWSPVLKGTHGDGKTLVTTLLRAAMGYRNVGVTGNSTLTANGGYNDWMVGSAVNIIEEIHLTGSKRYQLYNAMKECIANDIVNVNAKGDKTYSTHNCTNHWANTNQNDGVPLEKNDRRWFVVFTPWSSLPDMLRYCGLTDEGWLERTAAMDRAWREHGGELRAWFLSIVIGSEFNSQGSAPKTAERTKMIASSQDDAESVAASLIAEGGHGVTPNVLSSSCLSNLLKIRAITDGYELPRGPAMNHMLTRLGFSKNEKMVKWRGHPHTIWSKDGFDGDNEAIRVSLEATLTQLLP